MLLWLGVASVLLLRRSYVLRMPGGLVLKPVEGKHVADVLDGYSCASISFRCTIQDYPSVVRRELLLA